MRRHRACRRRSRARLRFRAVVAAVVTGLVGAGAVTSSATSAPTAPVDVRTAVGAPDATLSCSALAGRLSLHDQVGQLIMIAEDSRQLGAAARSVVASKRLGSVILLGTSHNGVAATRALDSGWHRTAHPTGVALMVAADQEGGLVQRLQGPGFSRIPSAVQQGRMSDEALERAAGGWSAQLDEAGVDVNLAPVADVVPSSIGTRNTPIGGLYREYSSDPSVVAAKSGAFLAGMHAGRTATAIKHFPGLGRVTSNTDTHEDVVDHTTTRHDALLAGFSADIAAGTDLVMTSSAIYSRIDPRSPAAFSPIVITGMLRSDRHFEGVVISDDLFARALDGVSDSQRAVRFVAAGGDLALIGNPAKIDAVYDGLYDRAHRDSWFRARVRQSATRVLVLKSRQGLAACTA